MFAFWSWQKFGFSPSKRHTPHASFGSRRSQRSLARCTSRTACPSFAPPPVVRASSALARRVPCPPRPAVGTYRYTLVVLSYRVKGAPRRTPGRRPPFPVLVVLPHRTEVSQVPLPVLVVLSHRTVQGPAPLGIAPWSPTAVRYTAPAVPVASSRSRLWVGGRKTCKAASALEPKWLLCVAILLHCSSSLVCSSPSHATCVFHNCH